MQVYGQIGGKQDKGETKRLEGEREEKIKEGTGLGWIYF